jgi:hypothetical protein
VTDPKRPSSAAAAAGRAIGGLAVLACAGGLALAWVRAPGIPDGPPQVERVDAALLARLRANPGLHVPLAERYTLEVPLELREDRTNRFLFGTEVDLREPVPRLSIHIQKKDGHAAIHADRFNPLAGALGWALHNSVDTPVVPLAGGLLAGAALLALAGRTRPGAS